VSRSDGGRQSGATQTISRPRWSERRRQCAEATRRQYASTPGRPRDEIIIAPPDATNLVAGSSSLPGPPPPPNEQTSPPRPAPDTDRVDRDGRGPTRTAAGLCGWCVRGEIYPVGQGGSDPPPLRLTGQVNRTWHIFIRDLGQRLEASGRSQPCTADRATRKEAIALVVVLNWSGVNSERQTVRRHHHSTRRNTSW
jgi:hypothetical protein